jgi:uncharacterized tellurite resistance protein B-like protein
MDPRIARCLLVSKILVADGIMTDAERAFLGASMTRMGLTEQERRSVFDLEGWDDAEQALASLSDDDKREIVSTLVDAAAIDGKLSALEMQAVKRITAALGLV